MKKCVTLFFLFFISWTYAREEGQILKCLGEEEKRLHLKKESGPIYDLNQRLISEMLQVPKADLVSKDFHEICSGNRFSESLSLLELSISKGKKLFIISKEIPEMQRSVMEGMIDDYIEATREILLQLITQIQASAPTPSCLKEEIPVLENFFTEIKYLQEDVAMETLFKDRDRKIFDKLKKYPSAYDKCRARLKKKEKSGSTTDKKV